MRLSELDLSNPGSPDTSRLIALRDIKDSLIQYTNYQYSDELLTPKQIKEKYGRT